MRDQRSEVMRAARRSGDLVALIVAVLVLVPLWPWMERASETRLWRDLTGQTPFHSVTVDGRDLTPEGLAIWGQMVKRRCEFVDLTAYVRAGNRWSRVVLDRSPEDSARPPGDRPALPDAQEWGPWVIRSGIPAPEAWAVWARHKCPGEAVSQQNLFATGDWPEGV